MIEIFFPDKYVDSVFDISLENLKKNNINTLIFDIDNTLVPYFIESADEKIKNYFKSLKNQGFKIGVLSNNDEKRVSFFCDGLDVRFIYKAGKPGIKGITKLMSYLESDNKTTALIGDQVFTDVWCGKRKGIYTILVKPVSSKDEWITKVKRGLERQVIKMYLKREGLL